MPASSSSQLSEFVRYCQLHTGRRFESHAAFHDFSVAESERFWALLLQFSALLHEGSPLPVRTSESCEHAQFFPNLRLSYAENLLAGAWADDAQGALIAYAPGRETVRLTRAQLRTRVLRLGRRLRELGVTPGDRVVAMAGNNAELVIGALAATSIGATFSCGSPQMGVAALLSRFAQLEPRVLLANLLAPDSRPLAGHVHELVSGLPSLRAVIALDEGPMPPRLGPAAFRLRELLDGPDPSESWERLPFNHPLFVLFTSGTTGAPKCLPHGAGGTLLEHIKEHRFHVDLRPGERLFFHTSAAWMMWNWQLSALASGAELVLYDGPLEGPQTLWELVRRERVNVFGTSPPYLQLCQDNGYHPGDLPALRTVLSTGSILHDWQYDWVAEHVGPVALQSISGGTDIIGCFVLGHPGLPVRRGLIQCRSLGMDVQAAAPEGEGPGGGQVGELVCRNPFPSRPLGIYGDDGLRFHAAYFEEHPGVWTHGDLIEFEPDGQARIHGRSDGVLNIGGERIGPADIYRALRGLEEVAEALAVPHERPDGELEIALLVVLRSGAELDDRLVVRIRREVATQTSPSHVPSLVVAVGELPATHSGKRSERAARDAINGRPIGNPEALANPGSLPEIAQAVSAAVKRRDELEAAVARLGEEPLERRLLAIWEAIFGIPLSPHDNFFDLGGTSLLAINLLQAIHERIGIDLPPAAMIHADTPARMARLIEGFAERPAPLLVPLRPGDGDRPVFLIHPGGGDVLSLRPLALTLETDRPVYGVQARGLDPRETPHHRVEDMAETYIEAIRQIQPHGPYALGGYSLGGLVAFEMARRLAACGEQVDSLVLIDAELRHSCLPPLARWRFRVIRLLRLLRHGLAAPGVRFPAYMRAALLHLMPRLPIEPPSPEEPMPPRLAQLRRAGLEAFAAYRPRSYSGSVTLLLADSRYPGTCDPLAAWRRYLHGAVHVERIPCDHNEMLKGASLTRLAAHYPL